MSQLALFPILEPEYEVEQTITERFAAFHALNPHVADVLEDLARQWLARHRVVGMKALYERARWESGINTRGDVWRLNNSYTAHYSRLLLDRHPEWTGRIHTRALRAA